MKEQTKELLKAMCENFNKLESITLDNVNYRIYGFTQTIEFILSEIEENNIDYDNAIMICYLVEYDSNEDLYLNEYRFSINDLDSFNKVELFKSEKVFEY